MARALALPQARAELLLAHGAVRALCTEQPGAEQPQAHHAAGHSTTSPAALASGASIALTSRL